MSTEHKNGYRQPVKFTNLVKAEFDENEKRFHLLVSDLEAAEANVERLEQQLACAKKDLGKAEQAQVLAEGNAASLRQQNQTLQHDYRKAKAAAEDLDKQVGSLKRTQLAFIDREDFVNIEISEHPISGYGRESQANTYFVSDRLVDDKNAKWYYFSDYYQDTQRDTLKQRALIKILSWHIGRVILFEDFKNVTLAQHPANKGEPICESIFFNRKYLGVFSVNGEKVSYFPPEKVHFKTFVDVMLFEERKHDLQSHKHQI